LAVVSPGDPTTLDVDRGLSELGLPLPPSADALLGTDHLGRDVWSRVVHGARYSILIGVASTALGVLLGVTFGLIAGVAHRRIDEAISRVFDAVGAFPDLLFALMLSGEAAEAEERLSRSVAWIAGVVCVAFFAMLAFTITFVGSIIYLFKSSARADAVAEASAEVGVFFGTLLLITGSIWGRPTWGTYWAWDARMTSELILLFLYFGVIALRNAIDDPRRADRACAVLTLVGAVNVPIIYYSVRWWNTLHQGASVSPTGSSMATTMLTGMLRMTLGGWMYSIAVALARVPAGLR